MNTESPGHRRKIPRLKAPSSPIVSPPPRIFAAEFRYEQLKEMGSQLARDMGLFDIGMPPSR